jgi:hypothetical protein
MQAAFMNMQGMGTRGAVNSAKVRRLIGLAEREGVNLIGMAETWLASSMVDTQMELILRNTGWRWIGRSREKCKSSGPGRPSGGVGLLYRAELGVVTVGKDQGCDGLLWATWNKGGVKTTIAVVYFVPNHTATQRSGHNEKLEQAFTQLMVNLTGERVMVLGDVNGRFGKLESVTFRSFNEADGDEPMEETAYPRQNVDEKINKQGREMVDMFNTANMVILNGVNSDPMEYTQVGSLGWSVVDIVAVTPQLLGKWGVKVIEDSDIEVGSDHRMIMPPAVDFGPANVQAESKAVEVAPKRASWRRKRGIDPDFWKEMIKIGEAEAKDYVRGWSDAIVKAIGKGDPNVVEFDAWGRYRIMARKALEEGIGRVKPRPRKQGQWYEVFDAGVQGMKREAYTVRAEMKRCRREGKDVVALRRRYAILKKSIKTRVKELLYNKAEDIMSKVEQMHIADPKNSWKTLKELIGMADAKAKPKWEKAVDSNGMEHTGEKVKGVVAEAFRRLGIEDLEDDKFDKFFAEQVRKQVRRASMERLQQTDMDEKFTLGEIAAVIKRLKAGKAAGEDEIIAEWLKFGGEKMTYALFVLCNHMWLTEGCPEDWGRGMISLLFKDGDKRDPLDYRGITLLSVVGKTFASLLNERLMIYHDKGERLVDEQAGFRKGRSCMDQIFILKETLASRIDKKTYTCFIDIRKAYDRVWRDGLWKALWDQGVNGKMWRVLRSYYAKVQSCAIVNGELTEWFDLHVGVRQGCVLSPILFDIFMDGMAREIKVCGLGVDVDGGERLACLLYADDLVLIAETKEDLQKQLDAVHEFCRKWRVELNQGKTKVVVFGSRGLQGVKLRCGEMEVEEAEEYKYLACYLRRRAGRSTKTRWYEKRGGQQRSRGPWSHRWGSCRSRPSLGCTMRW